MAAKKTESAPLTFDLRKDLLTKIETYQKKAGIKSKSEVIRDAIEHYDYSDFRKEPEDHRQISVRLPVTQKRELSKLARQKKVSLGELLRAALEALPEAPSADAGAKPSEEAPVLAKAKKAVAKKPAKKTAGAKKAIAKAAPATAEVPAGKSAAPKKGPVKKSAKKVEPAPAVAKKAPAKAASSKKAVPSKKTAGKKKK